MKKKKLFGIAIMLVFVSMSFAPAMAADNRSFDVEEFRVDLEKAMSDSLIKMEQRYPDLEKRFKLSAKTISEITPAYVAPTPSPLASSEMYFGHSVNGVSDFTGDEVFGILTDVGPVRLGAGRFTSTHYAHVLVEGNSGPLFAGVGIGAADKHRALDNYLQFTLTAGVTYERFVFRWMHMSNAANLFQHGDESAKQRDKGVDFFTVGVKF